MVPEFYLIIFLMVTMLIFTWFYSKRAENRRVSRTTERTTGGQQDPQ